MTQDRSAHHTRENTARAREGLSGKLRRLFLLSPHDSKGRALRKLNLTVAMMLLFLPGSALSQSPDAPEWVGTLPPPDDGAGLLDSLDSADFNGDGVDDVLAVVGGYAAGSDGIHDDDVYVHHSDESGQPASVPDWTFVVSPSPLGSNAEPLSPITEAGWAGDLNGDGFADLWVSNYRYSEPTSISCGDTSEPDFRGRVWIFLGSAGGLSDAPAQVLDGWIFHDFDCSLTWQGQWREGMRLGLAVDRAGDVDGDGHDDLLIQARPTDTLGNTLNSYYLYRGGSQGLSETPSACYGGCGVAPAGVARSVTSAAGLGDSNGDGMGEIALAIREWQGSFDPVWDADEVFRGIRVLAGKAAGPPSDVLADIPLSSVDWPASCKSSRDLSGDGLGDLVVHVNPPSHVIGHGVRVWYARGETAAPGEPAEPVFPETADWAWTETTEVRLRSVSHVGDANGDEIGDLILLKIRVPESGAQATQYSADFYHGAVGGLSAVGASRASPTPAGTSYLRACLGDVDGDGQDDAVLARNLQAGPKEPVAFLSPPSADPSCEGGWGCPAAACTDGLDNDGDGYVDCEDADCPCFEYRVVRNAPLQNAIIADVLGLGPTIGDQATPWPRRKVGLGFVLPHSGQAHHEVTDYFVRGRDPATDINIQRRHVSSLEPLFAPLGPSWHFSYHQTIIEDGNGDLVVEGFGRSDRFARTSETSWIGQHGHYGRISLELGKLKLRFPDGRVFTYKKDPIEHNGILERIESRTGSVVRLQVGSEFGDSPSVLEQRITKITDSFGRNIHLEYAAAGHATAPRDALTRIFTDFDDTEILYEYEDGRLSRVTRNDGYSGPNPEDIPAESRTTTYTYIGPTGNSELDALLEHSLDTVTLPEQVFTGGGPALDWDYHTVGAGETLGWVHSLDVGGTDGGAFSFDYSVHDTPQGSGWLVETVATDPNGQTATMKLSGLGNLLESEVAGVTQSFDYNGDGKLKAAIDPLGGTSSMTHDDGSGTRANQGDWRSAVLTPDARGAAQAEIRVETYTEPVFHQVHRVVDARGNETRYTLDYMEWTAAAAAAVFAPRLGVAESSLLADFAEAGVVFLDDEDANGDGVIGGDDGLLVRIDHPLVTEPFADWASDPEAQDSAEAFQYNAYGQLTRHDSAVGEPVPAGSELLKHPENTVAIFEYYPATEPAGGAGSPNGAGGYLRRVVRNPDEDGIVDGDEMEHVTEYRYAADPLLGITANARGVPTAITNARGVTTVFDVNGFDEVTRIRRAAAASSPDEPTLEVFDYEELRFHDRNGYLTRIEIENSDGHLGDQPNVVFTYERDRLGKVRLRTADLGGLAIKTKFDYDDNQRLIRRTDALGISELQRVMEWSYDERDLLREVRYDEGGIGATYTFRRDDNGNVIEVLDASGDGPTGARDRSYFHYDGFDRLFNVRNREDEHVWRSFDASSNIETLVAWKGANTPLPDAEPSAPLARTTWKYDERNRRFEQERHFLTGIAPGSAKTTWEHDRLSRLAKLIDDEGHETELTYDALSRLVEILDAAGNVTEREHDLAGNLTRLTRRLKLGIHEESLEYIAEFDSLNRRKAFVEPNGQRTEFEYDSRSNLIRRRDGLENEVDYHHDALNRLLRTERWLSDSGVGATALDFDPLQGGGDGVITSRQTWDELHRLVSREDDNGRSTTYQHDALDRLVGIDYADGTSEIFEWNADSELTGRVRQNGVRENYTLDDEGRPIALNVDLTGLPAGDIVLGTLNKSWSYDGLGRLETSYDDNGPTRPGVTTHYEYDDFSRPLFQRQQLDGELGPQSVGATWDDLSRLETQTFPDGRVITRDYDEIHRLTDILEGSSGPSIASYTWVGDRIATLTLGNGLMLDKRNDAGTSTIEGLGAGYDENGRTIRHEWTNGSQLGVAGYLTEWNGPDGVGTNRRVSEERVHFADSGFPGPPHVDTYTFDSAYRQLSFLRNSSISSFRALDGVNKATAFFDEGVNRVPVVDGDLAEEGMNQYSSMDGIPRSYSDTGSLEGEDGRKYFFDYSNRLVEVRDSSDNLILENTYDAGGRRVLSTVSGSTTRFLHWGWQVVEERDGAGNVLRQHVTGLGLDDHVQMKDVPSGQTYYHLDNDQGFTGVLTNSLGLPVEFYEYSWLGRPTVYDLSQPGVASDRSSVGNPYLFQARRWEPEVGLYDFRNRYYSPSVGEFVSSDPLGNWAHGTGGGHEAFGGDAWNASDALGLSPSHHGPYDPDAPPENELLGTWQMMVEDHAEASGSALEVVARTAVSAVDTSVGGVLDLVELTADLMQFLGKLHGQVVASEVVASVDLPDRPLADLGVYDPTLQGGETGAVLATGLEVVSAGAAVKTGVARLLSKTLKKSADEAAAVADDIPIGGEASAADELIATADDAARGGAGNSGVRILERDGDVIEGALDVAGGEARFVGSLTREGDTLFLRGAHVEGDATLRELIEAGRAFGREQGVSRVVIEGGRRTTGARPGHIPKPIEIIVD